MSSLQKKYLILTLFPDLFPGPLQTGVTGRGIEQNRFSLESVDIRSFADGRHRIVDDTPYGGGGGMIMKPGPVVKAIEYAKNKMHPECPVVLMGPKGKKLTQSIVQELSNKPGLTIVCGRYEGIDERVRNFIDYEISIGDFIVSGGELPALLLIDSMARHIPGVLGNPDSLKEESFQRPFLEYPHYTRPSMFREHAVPQILLSGDHAKIRMWRLKQSLLTTLKKRPDLLQDVELTKEEEHILEDVQHSIHSKN